MCATHHVALVFDELDLSMFCPHCMHQEVDKD
jgi:hypothetical protein